MKALIIDHETGAAELLTARLRELGVDARVCANKTDAIAAIPANPVDIVFLDPAPQKDSNALVVSIRKAIPTYTPVVLMGPDMAFQEAVAGGANDVLKKPFRPPFVNACLENARRIVSLVQRLNDLRVDYPSGGGVIAKSAFCQLFLSAIERAERYGEQSAVLFLRLLNHTQIKVHDSEDAGIQVAGLMLRQVLKLRRQTDILGQTGDHEYAILLQRPNYAAEPIDAALRFADQLGSMPELQNVTTIPIELEVELVELPSGRLMAHHAVTQLPRAPAGPQ